MKNSIKGIGVFLLYIATIFLFLLLVDYVQSSILKVQRSLTDDITISLFTILFITIIFLIFLSISAIKCIKLNNRKVIIYVLPIILILLANMVFWIYNAI